MEIDLNGKVALVTGAARGIGARIAERLAEHGAIVVVTDIDSDGARRKAAAIGASAGAITMDVRDRKSVRQAVAQIVGECGGIDLLVNNAGVITAGAYTQTGDQEWDELVAVNLTGIYNCVQAVVPAMQGRAGAAMINIASVAAAKGGGSVGNVWYGATKAAVVAITTGLARELGRDGIRVNAIAPGLVDTEMVRPHLTAAVLERVLPRFPLGRIAETDDVARLAVFLASPASGFITGATIPVDGGLLCT